MFQLYGGFPETTAGVLASSSEQVYWTTAVEHVRGGEAGVGWGLEECEEPN